MPATRYFGRYVMTVQWTPEAPYTSTPWVAGQYTVKIQEPGKRRALDDEFVIVWNDNAKSSHRQTRSTLGLSDTRMDSPRAYDVIAVHMLAKFRKHWPNRTLYQEMETAGMQRARVRHYRHGRATTYGGSTAELKRALFNEAVREVRLSRRGRS